MVQCAGLDVFDLKLVSSLESNASARAIYNENFKKLKAAITCLKNVKLSDLSDVIVPTVLATGKQYIFQWDGTNYTIVEANNNPGTKYIIQADEYISVLHDYQYIVNEYIYIYGVLHLEGELVIL